MFFNKIINQMTQNQHQRQISNFTFHSKTSKKPPQQFFTQNPNDINYDQNFIFTIGSLDQQLQAFQKQYQQQYFNQYQKPSPPIKKQQLQKVLKFFKKYQPIYFSKFLIKQMSYKFKKGVYIKKYKQGYYFGQVLEIKKQDKNLYKIKQGKGILVYNLFSKNPKQQKRIYQGQWQNDKKHGLGFEKFIDGSVYHGYYSDNKPEGRGKFTNSQGQIYQGQWKNGIKEGKGFWQGIHGQTYMGEWRNGKPEGYGVLVNQNGNRYEGQFKNSMKFGEGIQRFSNGDLYKGHFQNDKPNGYGQYYWKNKSYFKGYFSNGLREGQGLWKKGAGNCDKYQGQYQSDKKWGYGVFTWANGNIYKGSYQGDLRNGYGQMFWKDGSYYKGQWKSGVQHGKGELFVVKQGLRVGIFDNNEIKQIEYQEPITDCQNEQQQDTKPKNNEKILYRNLSKTSNLSVKSKNSKNSSLSKQKTLLSDKNRKEILKTKPSQQSLILQINNQKARFFSEADNAVKSVPIKKLIEHAEKLKYFSKGKNDIQNQFRISQKTVNRKVNQSLDNSQISNIQRPQKRKNRILHSSFYLHKFRKIKSPQKQASIQKQHEQQYIGRYQSFKT